jgi:hypothetical protein
MHDETVVSEGKGGEALALCTAAGQRFDSTPFQSVS